MNAFLISLTILFFWITPDKPRRGDVPGKSEVVSVQQPKNPYYSRTDTTVLNVPDATWKKILSPEVYHIAREKGTERAFTGKYWNATGIGTYYCAVCGNNLSGQTLNLPATADGPAFSSHIVKRP